MKENTCDDTVMEEDYREQEESCECNSEGEQTVKGNGRRFRKGNYDGKDERRKKEGRRGSSGGEDRKEGRAADREGSHIGTDDRCPEHLSGSVPVLFIMCRVYGYYTAPDPCY